jgi:hypothetical protein
MNEITKALTQIALTKSIPFCYSCYARAPTGTCDSCGSDDLIFELPGVAVEFGTDWLLREILREHLTPANTLHAFEESVTECYPESVKIGWIECDTATAIKELDPVSWEMAHSEWIDAGLSDGNLLTFDNGTSYYWLGDIEQFITDSAADAATPSA